MFLQLTYMHSTIISISLHYSCNWYTGLRGPKNMLLRGPRKKLLLLKSAPLILRSFQSYNPPCDTVCQGSDAVFLRNDLVRPYITYACSIALFSFFLPTYWANLMPMFSKFWATEYLHLHIQWGRQFRVTYVSLTDIITKSRNLYEMKFIHWKYIFKGKRMCFVFLRKIHRGILTGIYQQCHLSPFPGHFLQFRVIWLDNALQGWGSFGK